MDDELIKTKGLLRNPSLRDKKGERKRRERDGATDKADRSLEKRDRDGTDWDWPGDLVDIDDPDTDRAEVELDSDIEETSVIVLENGHCKDSCALPLPISPVSVSCEVEGASLHSCDSPSEPDISPKIKSKSFPRSIEETRGKGLKGELNGVFRSSSEVDSETIRNLLKDIEKVKKRDPLGSASRVNSSGDSS